ncbi:recombination regulator RecX [Neisseria sp. 83E34]|uniref:recombination regulator RecX n=1 Tax=Neisseria sp. 83E34 TaxID=1692264 RepID=UPI0006CE69FD|nr:recombination regulator RecX [Neisseria sp. 83E34]KPN72327.1 recombinase RecX [Neisseria sp. 83E34]
MSKKSLRARALDILSRREISRIELKRKLAPYAESEEEVEKVLNEFAERNWQSDQRFTESFIHSKSNRYGTRRLKQALAEKGIDANTAQAFMPDHTKELTTAKNVLRKKFKQPPANLADKYKYMRFLAYRGFDIDTINQAIKSAWDEECE